MGLFTPKISNRELEHVTALLNQTQETAQILNTTTSPDVFFKRLNFLLDLLLQLRAYEKYKIFKGGTPTNDYNKTISNMGATVNDFLDRAIADNQKKIDALKTPSAKERNYNKFTSALIAAFDCANSFWGGNRGLPHYTGPLFTEQNYQRVKNLFENIPSTPMDTPVIYFQNDEISPDDYVLMREREAQWLEQHYDFSTIKWINSIQDHTADLMPAEDTRKEIDKRRAELLLQAKHSEYNLIEAGYVRCVCSECAKYRERFYCIAGENKKYPTLPDLLLDPTHDCDIILFPVIENVSGLQTRDGKDLYGKELIRHSNRPFVDDRTPDELHDIQVAIEEKLRAEEKARKSAQTSKEYDLLWEYMPELCPKSLGGYSRMKNMNSEKFQIIKTRAQEQGFEIT